MENDVHVHVHVHVRQEEQAKLELGAVICKRCNEVLYTIPTNGVKRIYGICTNPDCSGLVKKEITEGEEE